MNPTIPGTRDDDRALADWEHEGGSTDARNQRYRTRRDTAPASPAATTQLRRIAILGNHLPRQCGIATFTTDLTAAITREFPALDCFVLAMNDAGPRYLYPEKVRFELTDSDTGSYQRAADFLNLSQSDVVSVQHEFGIFGGKAGSHLIGLLRALRLPAVTTLHTILNRPDPSQRGVMDDLIQLSERLVVMSAGGRAVLHETYGVPEEKIDFIPHGIPDLPHAAKCRATLGMTGKRVLLSFGLLSPDKGIEHVIDALPMILKRFPNAIYILLGATHPHVKASTGETYRMALEAQARRLGVASSVVFYNRFVTQSELTAFLAAADIYVTPYLNPEQSTSGTLAYAVGSGKAAVSTPYPYARELLANGRGVVVPWPHEDPAGIGEAIVGLLGDDAARRTVCDHAAAYGRDMRWPAVARTYVRSLTLAHATHSARHRQTFHASTLAHRPPRLPEINLSHLSAMSDSTGLLQHALHGVPRFEQGYCVDDNARALLLSTMLEDGNPASLRTARKHASTYLAFLAYAFDAPSGRFRNFMSYARTWIDAVGSEDSHGRALWGLGYAASVDDPSRGRLARSLLNAGLLRVPEFTSPRAWSYTLLGLDAYLDTHQEPGAEATRDQLAMRLSDLHERTSTESWPWFEPRATYCNARLSQALILSGVRMRDATMKARGLNSLSWLARVQQSASPDRHFTPIGSNGFYAQDGARAEFDQQPVEAASMVSACLSAFRVTGEARWAGEACRAFEWFLGRNQLSQALYDPSTGGCRDGLHPDRVNENQGAESTVSFLLALIEMRSTFQSAPALPRGAPD